MNGEELLNCGRQRQRRIIAPNLNETIMGNVWRESCHQAQAMVDYMVQHPGGETLSGLRSIAINVLGKAGYGQSQPWSPDFAKSLDEGEWSDGGRVAYFRTIALVTSQFVAAVLIPNRLKKLPFMPKSLRFLAQQMENVPQYIREIFREEAESQKQTLPEETVATRSNNRNMLDMLLQYSNQRSSSSGLYLTDDEVSGNLWVFTAAGFEATANTMGFSVALLTVYPEYQDWVREELQSLSADVSEWEYEEVFSRCPRVLAVMVSFAILRIYRSIDN
jgi:cytochrome P450